MVNIRPNRGLDPGVTAIWERKLFEERGIKNLKKLYEKNNESKNER